MFGKNSELELFLFVGELSSVFKRASYVSMSKATAKNDSNVSTKIVAAKFEKEIYYCDFYIFGQIVEAANLPEDISTYVLKENKVKMIRP